MLAWSTTSYYCFNNKWVIVFTRGPTDLWKQTNVMLVVALHKSQQLTKTTGNLRTPEMKLAWRFLPLSIHPAMSVKEGICTCFFFTYVFVRVFVHEALGEFQNPIHHWAPFRFYGHAILCLCHFAWTLPFHCTSFGWQMADTMAFFRAVPYYYSWGQQCQ